MAEQSTTDRRGVASHWKMAGLLAGGLAVGYALVQERERVAGAVANVQDTLTTNGLTLMQKLSEMSDAFLAKVHETFVAAAPPKSLEVAVRHGLTGQPDDAATTAPEGSRSSRTRPREDGGYNLAPSAYAELFVGPDAFRHLRRYLPLALSGEFDVHIRRPPPKGWPDAFTTPRKWEADEASPFEHMRILDPAPNKAKVAEVSARFGQLYPDVGKVTLQASWAGLIDVLPDVVLFLQGDADANEDGGAGTGTRQL